MPCIPPRLPSGDSLELSLSRPMTTSTKYDVPDSRSGSDGSGASSSVAPVTRAGADHAHRIGRSDVQMPPDLVPDRREPITEAGVRPGVSVVPLRPVGAHDAPLTSFHRVFRRTETILATTPTGRSCNYSVPVRTNLIAAACTLRLG